MGLGEFPQHMKSWSLGLGVGGCVALRPRQGWLCAAPWSQLWNFTPLKGSRAPHRKNKRFLPSVAARPSSEAARHTQETL